MLTFICYPKCTTCQKAKKWLEGEGKEFQVRDIKEENPTVEELRLWWQRSGLPLKKFFNTSGLQYKALNLKDKLPGMSEEEQTEMIEEYYASCDGSWEQISKEEYEEEVGVDLD